MVAEVEHPTLASCEPGLRLSPSPVWVFVADSIRFCWANDAALELWNASSREELFGRDMLTGVPDKVVARTEDVVARVRAGQVVREEWIVYPRGVMTTVALDIRGVTLPDGGLGLLNHAQPAQIDTAPSVLRSLAMFRHSGAIGVLVDADGQILWRNPTAMHVFGASDSWSGWLVDAETAEDILRRVVAGEAVEQRVEVVVRGERRWHQLEAHTQRDPVTTQIGALIEHVDVTAEVEAVRLAAARGHTIDSLNAALELVEHQRQEILELSAPMLDVGGGTLAVPLIGRLDPQQSESLTARLLDAVVARGARTVLLDVTGLAAVDEHSASRLDQLIGALGLLGVTTKVTGVRPQLAVELSRLGLELGGVETLRSLADGLRRARA